MNRPENRPSRRPDGAALFTAAALALLGAMILWDSSRLPADSGYSGVGPADVPRLIAIGLVLLGGWTFIDGFRGAADTPSPQQALPVLWIIGGLGAQLVLLGVVGFSIATGLLFACTARAFGYRRLLLALLIGILACLAVYGLFDRVLQLNLPAGPLETAIFGA
jgi:putative tricarboxylic transport membrane protein